MTFSMEISNVAMDMVNSINASCSDSNVAHSMNSSCSYSAVAQNSCNSGVVMSIGSSCNNSFAISYTSSCDKSLAPQSIDIEPAMGQLFSAIEFAEVLIDAGISPQEAAGTFASSTQFALDELLNAPNVLSDVEIDKLTEIAQKAADLGIDSPEIQQIAEHFNVVEAIAVVPASPDSQVSELEVPAELDLEAIASDDDTDGNNLSLVVQALAEEELAETPVQEEESLQDELADMFMAESDTLDLGAIEDMIGLLEGMEVA